MKSDIIIWLRTDWLALNSTEALHVCLPLNHNLQNIAMWNCQAPFSIPGSREDRHYRLKNHGETGSKRSGRKRTSCGRFVLLRRDGHVSGAFLYRRQAHAVLHRTASRSHSSKLSSNSSVVKLLVQGEKIICRYALQEGRPVRNISAQNAVSKPYSETSAECLEHLLQRRPV